jgi:hypothetical protein
VITGDYRTVESDNWGLEDFRVIAGDYRTVESDNWGL